MGYAFRKSRAAVAAVAVFCLGWAFSAKSLGASPDERQPLLVIVGIAPVAHLVEQVGGDRVKVEVLAPTGACSHQLSLSPKQSQSLAKADLLLTINMPFERQLAERLRQTGSNVVCVDVSATVKQLPAPSAAADQNARGGGAATPFGAKPAAGGPGTPCPHGCDHDHDHNRTAQPAAEGVSQEAMQGHACGDPNCHDHSHDVQAFDPHIWLDPVSLPRLVENIAAALTAADAADAELFRRNQQMVQQRIAALNKRLEEQLRPLAGQSIYVYHPSLGYLCKAYGLRQIAVESEGKSPSAKQLRALIQQARAERVRAVFVEPSGDQRAAAAVAQAIGAKLVVFDPMTPDVVTNLADAAEQICRHQVDR